MQCELTCLFGNDDVEVDVTSGITTYSQYLDNRIFFFFFFLFIFFFFNVHSRFVILNVD